MKKIVIVLILLLSLIFSSCAGSPQLDGLEQDHSTKSTTNEDSTKNNNGEELLNETPEEFRTYPFESYSALKNTLDGSDTRGSQSIRNEQIEYGRVYQSTLRAFETQDIKVVVPYFNGNTMELRNKEGFSNITLMTNELYNLPWIWYHCKLNDKDIDVRISYVSVLNNSRIDDTKSLLDILSIIAPDAPSPSNYHNKKGYKNIYEREIALGDRTVTAVISELNDSNEISVNFHIDGVLVVLKADKEVFSDEFFASFSLK